jgi:hypothetical protein
MNKENRRTFLRQFGLTVGALTIGADTVSAFLYQKKSIIRKTPGGADPETVDFRYAPDQWRSPLRRPGAVDQSLLDRAGGLFRPGTGETIDLHIDGAGEITELVQHCEAPHLPFISTSVSYGEPTVEITAFSSVDDDEGAVDNITVSVTPAGKTMALRLVLGSEGGLEARIDDDDDLPRGKVCIVTARGDSDAPFLILDAGPVITRDGDSLVLTVPVGPGDGSAPATFRLRIPGGRGDTGDIVSGSLRLSDRAVKEREWWTGWKTRRAPSGWNLPGIYGEFSMAGARIIDQMTVPAPIPGEKSAPVRPRPRPDLVDEHFISEAELYLGRANDAQTRLEAMWKLENESGMLVGAGGEANMKEVCAAVYSLCRHAELTGDWKYFNELYPDAFNALDALRARRDLAAAGADPTPNAKRNLLPEGSPGRGWTGIYEELTNTLWAMIALKPLLEISDRRFLMKKSQIREFYGELRIACVTAARDTLKTGPEGFSWFPIITAPAPGGGTDAADIRPQSGLGTLAVSLFPGLLFKTDDTIVKDFPAWVNSSLDEEIPAGTGPGPAGSHVPVDAALTAQALVWFNLPEEARKIFVGCLNHASTVYTWNAPSGPPAADDPGGVDLRASAEAIRYMRHAMVMEDEETLRLFDGIARADLAPGQPLRLDHTPTRWGSVSLALEPVDARTWKVSFAREPVGGVKPPPIRSVEMPRVLGPNFRFDTIAPGNAIKNGPRVVIDPGTLQWEAFLRDLRR